MYKLVEDLLPISDYVKLNDEISMVVNIVKMQGIIELCLYNKQKRHHSTYHFPYGVQVKTYSNPHT